MDLEVTRREDASWFELANKLKLILHGWKLGFSHHNIMYPSSLSLLSS
jgi:hypothetical protein